MVRELALGSLRELLGRWKRRPVADAIQPCFWQLPQADAQKLSSRGNAARSARSRCSAAIAVTPRRSPSTCQ